MVDFVKIGNNSTVTTFKFLLQICTKIKNVVKILYNMKISKNFEIDHLRVSNLGYYFRFLRCRYFISTLHLLAKNVSFSETNIKI